jgi:hypothetical protein
MKKRNWIAAVALMLLQAPLRAAAPVSLDLNGWRVEADSDKSTLRVSHVALGVVLDYAHLSVRRSAGWQSVTRWSAQEQNDHLLIRSTDPPVAFQIELAPNALQISSTSAEARLEAETAASENRIIARLQDREGFPVVWQGTSEVRHNYDGSKTQRPSYLPRRNPDVMYLALGPVSGPQFHSLFDRQTDTALDFGEGAALSRSATDANILQLQLPITGNALVRVIPDYFTNTLGLPFYAPLDTTHFKTAPMVWSSWTSYYQDVTENDMVRNADWLAANLKPYGFQFVQLDDGYDRGPNGEHTWIGPWDSKKFPHGPQWLTNYIKSKGLRAGIWLVPNAYAGAVDTHPDWYLHNKQGKLIPDYSTPSLDSSNPEVLGFLQHLFNTLDDWGFDYYKFDGEHAIPQYVPGVDKTKLHDPAADPIAIYRERIALIRKTIGPDRFIEGCPAGTPLNGIGFFNSYFNGDDLYANWQGMYPLFSSINANGFLNGLAVYVMPGEGLELGEPFTAAEAARNRPPSFLNNIKGRETPVSGFGTTLPEARTVITYVALTGVAYPLASVMPELPAGRVNLIKATMPTLPILPVDLYSRGTDMEWDTFKHQQLDTYVTNYPEILDLKVNGTLGVYDVVGVTNWTKTSATKELALSDKLGLASGASYVAFDFWNQKLLGVFKDKISLDVDPHDTRVLLLHPLRGEPQLLGTSRHISGSYSVRNVQWDSARRSLRGSSEMINGEPYTLWIHVPSGSRVANVTASAASNQSVPAKTETRGELLSVTIPGQAAPVSWQVNFASQ